MPIRTVTCMVVVPSASLLHKSWIFFPSPYPPYLQNSSSGILTSNNFSAAQIWHFSLSLSVTAFLSLPSKLVFKILLFQTKLLFQCLSLPCVCSFGVLCMRVLDPIRECVCSRVRAIVCVTMLWMNVYWCIFYAIDQCVSLGVAYFSLTKL